MYLMRANATLNSEMYSYCQTQMQHGKLKFLIDDNIAKNKLMSQSSGQKMSIEKRNEYLNYIKLSYKAAVGFKFFPFILEINHSNPFVFIKFSLVFDSDSFIIPSSVLLSSSNAFFV